MTPLRQPPPCHPRWRRPRTWLITAAAVLAVGGGATAWQMSHGTPPPRFITEPLKRGDLALAISANGTLQPTRSVSLGSELSGTVAKVLVDVNDHVKKGQVLARLSPGTLETDLAASRAALLEAEASARSASRTPAQSPLRRGTRTRHARCSSVSRVPLAWANQLPASGICAAAAIQASCPQA